MNRSWTPYLVLAAVILVPLLVLGPGERMHAQDSHGSTSRVSITSDGAQANGHSGYPAISADGRFVAFFSGATNLVPDDTNGYLDVFVRDRQTGQTTRVSVSSDGAQGNHDNLNYSVRLAISADGRYVAFSSEASNLVPGDTNNTSDVFVHDRQTGTTSRVSVSSDGTQGNSNSFHPAISGDGRFVAFTSHASNLVSSVPINWNWANVFLHDRLTDETNLISLSISGTPANKGAESPAISADGRYVAFESRSTNLISDDTNSDSDIFIHDQQTGRTVRISVASDGSQVYGYHGSALPAISADGRFVVFFSDAWNLVPGGTTDSADIYVHDRQTGNTSRVSVSSEGTQGNGGATQPTISTDGRFVAFSSNASNLVSGDTNQYPDIFVHDRQTGNTSRVSIHSDGTQGNFSSEDSPAISADGRYVAFGSGASNLVSGDTNSKGDIFVHDRGTGSGSVSGSNTIMPFLHLPVNYPDSASDVLKNKSIGGRINSWFDHSYPNRSRDGNLTLYTGETLTKPAGDLCFFGADGQYCYDGHGAIDFRVPEHDRTIFAAAAGTVIDIHVDCPEIGYLGSDCAWGFGNYVLLYHFQGYFTRYSHLRSVSVPNPDTPDISPEQLHLEAGDPLGVMGTSGNSSGVHLDFMVYEDVNGNARWDFGVDKQVDPFGYYVNGMLALDDDPWVADRGGRYSYPLWIANQPASGTTNGNEGAEISNEDQTVQVSIPPNYYGDAVTTIELNNNPPPAGILESLRRVGRWFWLRLIEYSPFIDSSGQRAPINPSEPITLVAEYPDSLLHHLKLDALQLMWWNETTGLWTPLPSTIDEAKRTVTAETMELGAFDLQAPLVCPLDSTEPDDNEQEAIGIASGVTSVKRWLDSQPDEDWFVFAAAIGVETSLEAMNDPGVIIKLELMDTDAQTVLKVATNHLAWTAPTTGMYFVRVTSAPESLVGCDAGYELLMVQSDEPTATPVPTSSVTMTPSATPTSMPSPTATPTLSPTMEPPSYSLYLPTISGAGAP